VPALVFDQSNSKNDDTTTAPLEGLQRREAEATDHSQRLSTPDRVPIEGANPPQNSNGTAD